MTFSGVVGDLHLGDQRVTWKKLEVRYFFRKSSGLKSDFPICYISISRLLFVSHVIKLFKQLWERPFKAMVIWESNSLSAPTQSMTSGILMYPNTTSENGGWKTSFFLGRPIFRGYVSFRECIIKYD